MKNSLFRRVLLGLAFFLALGYGLTWASDVHNLSASEAQVLIQENQNNPAFVILDVRTPAEYGQGHIAGAQLLDYKSARFSEGLERLDKTKTYFVYCRTGNRSGRALQLMESMGFGNIYHLSAGIMDWASHKLPLVK
jgi:rhodanese-related sulfurtransferase